MGRVAMVLSIITSLAAPALADEPPPPVDSPIPPDPVPPPVPRPPDDSGSTDYLAPTPPPPPATAENIGSDGFTVDRHGIMLLGGFRFTDGDRSQFLVVYFPLSLAAAPRLKLGLTGQLQYQRSILPGDDLIAWVYYVQPMAQYDWRLPIKTSKGDFAIAAQGGLGVGQIRIQWPAEVTPSMMTYSEHMTVVTIHMDAAFQFHAHNGLVVSLQPIGLTKLINDPDPPSPMWTVNTETVYQFAIAGGFRWR
jgi:hypothetical protein